MVFYRQNICINEGIMSHREENEYYIGANDKDIKEMLDFVGEENLESLYSHIPQDVLMKGPFNVPIALSHKEIKEHLTNISSKNNIYPSFIADGLQDYKIPEIVPKVCGIRGLTTAYTPYQPERSQGTLQTLWLYQSAISAITGFEAINASFYERSTCLFEAINTAIRIHKKSKKVLVPENLYPGDIEVLNTLVAQTQVQLTYFPIDKETGIISQSSLKALLAKETYAAIIIPQINNFGLIERFDELTDIAHENSIKVISLVDPMAITNNGLKEPSKWGKNQQGADLLVAEGQHLTLDPNYGGPGLGIFGIRYNEKDKLSIRQTAGRFIGKAKDLKGRDCKAIILSTREQHIRREKATSNICSNQSFIASACAASLLQRGDKGLSNTHQSVADMTLRLANLIMSYEGFDLKYPTSHFYNEILFKTKTDVKSIISEAKKHKLHLGVDVSKRNNVNDNLLLLGVSDKITEDDLLRVETFLAANFKKKSTHEPIANKLMEIEKRVTPFTIPALTEEDLFQYFTRLGEQNLSPDEGIYPLGSCTMKYNPKINDEMAALPGFTQLHPEVQTDDAQGCLEILYRTQELFKSITGLPGVTTQPVAGAQGELVGVKMFQAYHRERGEGDQRNIILIPKSAHGTNPATASVCGFETKKIDGVDYGIVLINASDTGEIDFEQFSELVSKYSTRICGVMITNPNTAGIFETKFKEMADLIHDVGGLVYMDGANMNAIAGWVDLNKMGVDAVHNNLHKTWSIPHGGGGPGDAIVAVSEKLIDYLPGMQVEKTGNSYRYIKPKNSIGSIHRHYGNFAHKVRAYTYLCALGSEGIKKMSAVSVLSARYLFKKLKEHYPTLPYNADHTPRMHEFILTLSSDDFARIATSGTPKAQTIARVGKLFLDFGFHAPTVAFPEVYGLMIEPTESYSKSELDQFADRVVSIKKLLDTNPEVLQTVPHFTPIDRVDELSANKTPQVAEIIKNKLDPILEDRVSNATLRELSSGELISKIVAAHHDQI
jgi:glycine dehydrogenase